MAEASSGRSSDWFEQKQQPQPAPDQPTPGWFSGQPHLPAPALPRQPPRSASEAREPASSPGSTGSLPSRLPARRQPAESRGRSLPGGFPAGPGEPRPSMDGPAAPRRTLPSPHRPEARAEERAHQSLSASRGASTSVSRSPPSVSFPEPAGGRAAGQLSPVTRAHLDRISWSSPGQSGQEAWQQTERAVLGLAETELDRCRAQLVQAEQEAAAAESARCELESKLRDALRCVPDALAELERCRVQLGQSQAALAAEMEIRQQLEAKLAASEDGLSEKSGRLEKIEFELAQAQRLLASGGGAAVESQGSATDCTVERGCENTRGDRLAAQLAEAVEAAEWSEQAWASKLEIEKRKIGEWEVRLGHSEARQQALLESEQAARQQLQTELEAAQAEAAAAAERLGQVEADLFANAGLNQADAERLSYLEELLSSDSQLELFTWTAEGKLGLQLEQRLEGGKHRVVVAGVTNKEVPLRLQGSTVVEVAGQWVLGQTQEKVLAAIAAAGRPLSIKFGAGPDAGSHRLQQENRKLEEELAQSPSKSTVDRLTQRIKLLEAELGLEAERKHRMELRVLEQTLTEAEIKALQERAESAEEALARSPSKSMVDQLKRTMQLETELGLEAERRHWLEGQMEQSAQSLAAEKEETRALLSQKSELEDELAECREQMKSTAEQFAAMQLQGATAMQQQVSSVRSWLERLEADESGRVPGVGTAVQF